MVKFVNVNLNSKNKLNYNLEKGSFSYLSYEDEEEKNLFLQMLTKSKISKMGNLFIDGYDIFSSKGEGSKVLLRKIGVAYSDFKFISYKNVLENLEYYLFLRGYTDEERADLSCEILDCFELWGKKDSCIEDLSSEEKHLLSLARALSTDPSYIILEDIHIGVEEERVKRTFLLLEELKKNNIGILYITNDGNLVERDPRELKRLSKGAIENV